MTDAQLQKLAARTEAMHAKMREAGYGCHCYCGCGYVLSSETSRARGVCFSCKAGVHYGSKIIQLEADA